MKVWIAKPVSVSKPPEKDGRYLVVGCDHDVDYVYFSVDFGWACVDGYFTHYLVPIEVDHVLTDKELEDNYQRGFNAGYKEAEDSFDQSIR